MTYEEINNFYKNDEKKYIVKENEEFLNWFFITIQNGYEFHFPYKFSHMQNLIDIITNWYEIKFPDFELKNTISDLPHLSSMTTEQLLARLDLASKNLMDAEKFYYNNILYPINSLEKENKGSFIVYKFTSPILMEFYSDGKLKYISGLNSSIPKTDVYADEVLQIIKQKCPNEYDLSGLENALYTYTSNIELRHRLLSLTALNILYSKKTEPELGYIRAKKFIKEFNEDLNLTLTTADIDNIMKTKKLTIH